LNSPLATDAYPIDVIEGNNTLFESVLEDDPIFADDKPSIANSVQNQCGERDDDKERYYIEDRVTKNERKRIFNEIPANPSIQDERHEVHQCLLIVKVKLILEYLPLLIHGFAESAQQG
jgi:hypothetical protein